MYREFQTFERASGAKGKRSRALGHVHTCVALTLAAALAGCTGTILNDGKSKDPSERGGGPGASGSGSEPGGKEAPATPTACSADDIGLSPLRRLTRQEYDNSVRDLLGLDLGLAQQFSADELAGPFPGNFFSPISESNYNQYAAAAATAAGKAVERLADLVPCAANLSAGDEASCATDFIRQFGRRAYRRPLDDDEVGRYEELYKVGRDDGDFGSGIRLVVEAMLESPHFLYLVEGPGALTQHQLAARLSYFLWNAPPDAKLAELADSGDLRTPKALRQEAQRMLADPRAQQMLDDFHARWLALEDLETLTKDAEAFPEFQAVHPFMREELRRFASHVMTEGDGKLETLFTAPFTIANGALADLYGASASGDDWQKVDLDPEKRAGLLTQSAFLATHGHEGSSPIFRGIAVREQIMCVSLPPPPPGADDLLPPASPTRTTRDRLEQHRESPECASCHNLMDVLGYGFESFDEIGRFRTEENGIPIDDSGEFVGTDIDGKFQGPIEMAKRLTQSTDVQRCVTTQWFRYALGRMETKLDTCALDSVLARFQESELRLPELLLALVESDAFRIRRAEETSP